MYPSRLEFLGGDSGLRELKGKIMGEYLVDRAVLGRYSGLCCLDPALHVLTKHIEGSEIQIEGWSVEK